MARQTNRFEQAWAEAVVRVWQENDATFRTKLLSDPKAAFAELGAEIPHGIQVKVIENSANQVNFVLPPRPSALEEVTDQNLDELYRACPGTVCAVPGGG
jgi:hypothetical protein